MVTAESFIKAFFEVVEKEQDIIDAKLGRVDKNKNRTELYTEYMMDTVLKAIAEKFNCRYEKEKYKLDAVFYSNEKKSKSYFHVAIEHENSSELIWGVLRAIYEEKVLYRGISWKLVSLVS